MVSTGLKYFFIITAIFINFSCIREVYNITGTAIVVDEETLNPVSNSSVHSQCFFQLNIDESSKESSSLKTDSLGIFQINFNKGYKVSMIIESADYVSNTIQFNPRKENMPDTIYLKKKIQFESSAAQIKSQISPNNNLK